MKNLHPSRHLSSFLHLQTDYEIRCFPSVVIHLLVHSRIWAELRSQTSLVIVIYPYSRSIQEVSYQYSVPERKSSSSSDRPTRWLRKQAIRRRRHTARRQKDSHNRNGTTETKSSFLSCLIRIRSRMLSIRLRSTALVDFFRVVDLSHALIICIRRRNTRRGRYLGVDTCASPRENLKSYSVKSALQKSS